MSNYLTQFAMRIDNLATDEMDWWEDPPESPGPSGFTVEVNRERRTVDISDDAGEGRVNRLGEVLQRFLAEFWPNEKLGFQWADTCSWHEPDSFGGGAMVVTADEVTYVNAQVWLDQHLR